MSVGIYIICNNVNKKMYVGKSFDIEARIRDHLNDLKNNRHCNKKLQDDYNKYGEDAFAYKILEKCPIDKLNIRELYYIEKYNTVKLGYNIKGGCVLDVEDKNVYNKLKSKINKLKAHSKNIRGTKYYHCKFMVNRKNYDFYGKTETEAINKAKEYIMNSLNYKSSYNITLTHDEYLVLKGIIDKISLEE